MGNLIIKPNTGGTLKLQEDGGTDVIEINTDGTFTQAGGTFTGAVTLPSPVITGTPTGITAAHLEAGVLPSDVTGGAGLTAIAGVTTGSGDVTVTNGNLVIGTHGKGIDFSANTDDYGTPASGAEVLDDYEEGTWTPVIAASSPSGSPVNTVTWANYQKIGNTVHINALVAYTKSSSTGTIGISGLPFTTPAISQVLVNILQTAGLASNTTWCTISPSSTIGDFFTQPQSTAGSSQLTTTSLGSVIYVRIDSTYTAA